VDVFEPPFQTWYTAKILNRTESHISIKYFGFSGKGEYAEIGIHDSAFSVSPALSKVASPNMRWGGAKSLQEQWEFSRNLVPQHMHASWDSTHPVPMDEKEKETVPSMTKHQEMLNAYIRAGGSSSKPTSRAPRGGESAASERDSDSPRDSTHGSAQPQRERKIKDVTKDGEDDNEWVCGLCKMLEAPDGSPLVLCDGPCMRSFHTSCLGYASNDDLPQVGGVWLCLDCEMGVHQCFICSKKGKDLLEVARCSQPRCGKYYHEDCLRQVAPSVAASSSARGSKATAAGNSGTMDAPDPHAGDPLYLCTDIKKVKRELPPVVEGRVQNSLHGNNLTDLVLKNGESSIENSAIRAQFTEEQIKEAITATTPAARAQALVDTFSFKCPHHQCRICYEFYTGPLCKSEKGKNEKGELFECIACPVAYHINCIPPGTRFNSICLLCNNHPAVSLPAREARSFRGATGSILEQCMLPEEPPAADDIMDHHFRLPLHIRDDVNSNGAPLKYKVINRLLYDTLPKKGAELPVYSGHDGGVCNCKGGMCGDECINRILKFECGSTAQRRGGEEAAAVGGNNTEKSSNCCIGPSCGNRKFANKEWSPITRFREHAMGFGCKATADILDGSLIIEYIGEVINDEEMETRMKNQREFTPNDHDFYIMQLDNGLYVDGKHKGNDSRFINHSCDPNCELERWVVNGKMRIGIFAIRDIIKGEPLSYDYQFDTKEVAAFKCYCGTAACRGSMAPKDKSQRTVKDLSSSQRKTLIKQGQARENKSEADQRVEEWSRSYTSRTLPGDPIRPVSEGPHRASLAFACHVVNNDHGVFLARNVECSSSTDWGKRRSHMWSLAAEEEVDRSKRGGYMQAGNAAKRRK